MGIPKTEGQPSEELARSRRLFAFVIGPMCTVNRILSELPSHRDCARLALALPLADQARRGAPRQQPVPEGYRDAAGNHLKHMVREALREHVKAAQQRGPLEDYLRTSQHYRRITGSAPPCRRSLADLCRSIFRTLRGWKK